MISKSKTPQIRFKVFSGEWEENKLGDIGSIGMNKRVFKNQTSNKGDIPFFKIGTFGSKADAFISRKLFEEYKYKYPYPKKGDLLISASGSIGRIVEYTGKDEYYQDSNIVWLMHDNLIVNSFLKQFYSVVKWSGLEGSTIKRLYNKNILETPISLPTHDEQSKIGDYFQNLDKLIEQKEKKQQKLKQFKKAMLDKMFPKNGADTPEVRFKGFSGEWKEIELDNIVNRYDNLRIPISAIDRISGITPYYGANGIQGYIEGYTHDGEFILVAEDGANDLKNYPVQYVNGKIWVNNHAHVLQAKEGLANNSFLKFAISKINIEPFLVGGGRAKLNANIMMSMNFNIPSNISEQVKIGNYFQKLDKQIDLQQKELEKLKNIKKASLAKMFV